MHRRGFLRLAVGSILIVPAGKFLVACSSDDGTGGQSQTGDTPAAPPVLEGTDAVYTSSLTEAHSHTLTLDQTDIVTPSAAVTTTTGTTGSHSHSVAISMTDLQNVSVGQTVKVATSTELGHSHILTLVKLTAGVDGGAGGGGGGAGGGGGGDGGGGGGTYPY